MAQFDKTNSAYELQRSHFIGAVIVTGSHYLLFNVLFLWYWSRLNPSVWASPLLDPIAWIALIIWSIVSRTMLARFGWSSPASALTQALVAIFIVSELLDGVDMLETTDTTYTYVFYPALLVLLLLFRNIERKRA